MKKQFILILIILVAIVSILTACSKQTTTTAASTQTLKVGCTLPFNNAFGIEANKIIKDIIIPDVNTNGIVIKGQRYNIQPIIYDDNYDANTGKAAAERLINQDNVKYIVGVIGSAPTVAMIPVCQQNNILLISGCTNNAIVGQNLTLDFRSSRAGIIEPALFASILKTVSASSLDTVVLTAPDDDSGHAAIRDYGVKICDYYKFKVLDTLYYPRDTTDFSALTTKIKSLNPKLVYMDNSNGSSDYALEQKALYQAGYRGKTVIPQTVQWADVSKIATNEQLEGTYCRIGDEQTTTPSPTAQKVINAYKAKYGELNTVGFEWVNAWYMFFAAMKKANSLDVNDIAAAMKGLEFDTAVGMVRVYQRPDLGCTRYCNSVYGVVSGEVTNGTTKVIGTASINDVVKICEQVLGGGTWDSDHVYK